MALELTIEERGAPPRTQVIPADTAFVGRREDCEVVLPYSFVSARHARIQVRAGTAHVEDLGSTNGVLVNGEPLAPLVPRALRPEDVVQIEKIAIRVRLAESASRAPEATFHEVPIPSTAVPARSPAPPPLPRVAPPPPPLPAPRPEALTPTEPLPLLDPAVVSDRSAATAPVPLAPLSLPETLRAHRVPERPRPGASRALAERVSGLERFFVLSLVFRGIGLLAVLGGLALLLLVLLA